MAFRTLLLLRDAIYQCAMPTHFLRPPQIPGNGVLGPSDFNASPQAVFTSFKLPKPGGGQPGQATPPAAAPPAPLPTPSSAAELLAMAAAGPDFKFSLAGGGGGVGGSGAEKVLSAPLGGLPAMASQIAAMAAAAAKKDQEGGEVGGGGGGESPPPLTVDPTAPSGGQRSQGSSPAPGDATSTPKKTAAPEEG